MVAGRLLIVLFCLCATLAFAKLPWRKAEVLQPRDGEDDLRLPTNVVPVEYVITLRPDFDNFIFGGLVDLTVTAQETSNTITFHINEITINSVTVTGPNGEVTVTDQQPDTDRMFWILTLESNLVAGSNYSLSIDYTGILNDDLRGFYRSSYVNADGETRWLATTHFEATSARRAFPSFDEPAFKATFAIRIYRDATRTSISNMPLLTTEPQTDGTFLDIFETSPRMSTYLVAFIVSDFEYLSQDPSRFVYARPQAIAQGEAQYAYDIGNVAISFMEEFTTIPFELPKLGQVAIPDFAPGAMENYGLVTYREPYLLWTEESSTTRLKQSVATVIAHELSHQWFGDLVTPRWWDAIWLNEGFATYFEYHATATFSVDGENTWKLPNQFVIESLQYSLVPDSLDTTHPVTLDGGSALFDTIAYDKAGSVIRMTEHFITTPAFRAGLISYLNEFNHNNTVPEDLFRHWQQGHDSLTTPVLPEGLTIPTILDGWTTQKGYPLIRVSVDQSSGNLIYTQERFLSNDVGSDTTTTWIVPINVATSANPDFTDTRATFWLQSGSATDTSINANQIDWYILNKQQTGYYRVNYPEENWVAIATYLNNHANVNNIHEINRAQIIDDAFILARSGVISYEIPLDITRYLQHETEYVPLYAFFNVLSPLLRILPNSEHSDHIKSFLSSVLDTTYQNLGVNPRDNDTHLDRLNRVNVVRYACLLGHAACRADSAATLRNSLTNLVAIHQDLTSTIFCAGMRSATAQDLISFAGLLGGILTDSLRSTIVTALGCIQNEDLLNTALYLTVQDTNVLVELSSSDRVAIFQAIYQGSDTGVEVAVNFLSTVSLSTIRDQYTSSGLQTILTGLGGVISTQSQLLRLTNVVDSLTDADEIAAGQSAIASATTFVNFAQEHVPELTSWIIRELNLDDDGAGSITMYNTWLLLTAIFAAVVFT